MYSIFIDKIMIANPCLALIVVSMSHGLIVQIEVVVKYCSTFKNFFQIRILYVPQLWTIIFPHSRQCIPYKTLNAIADSLTYLFLTYFSSIRSNHSSKKWSWNCHFSCSMKLSMWNTHTPIRLLFKYLLLHSRIRSWCFFEEKLH